MGNEVADASVWQIRAAAWELAALSLRYPGAELAGAAAGGEWDEAAGEILAALGLPAEVPAAAGDPAGPPAARAADTAGPAGADALLRALRPEATRLFVGAPEPACSPYEGVWAAEADGVQPLLFVNPRSMEVERFMRSCGLGRPEGTNEPLDHVATECELLERLALRAAGAPASEGAPDGGRPPRREPGRRLRGLPLRVRPSLDARVRRALGRRGAPSLLSRGGGLLGGARRVGRCQTGRFQPSFRDPLTR